MANTNSAQFYLNHDTGRVEHYGQVSTDLYMADLSATAKRKMLESDALEHTCALKEMKSRVKAIALVHVMGLDVPANNTFASLEEAIYIASLEKVHNKWQRVDHELTVWDIVLLELDCMTGESRLHQPCRYHEDGNNADWLETYVTMPKISVTQHGAGYSRETVTNAAPADISLVHQGFLARTRPGRDILHLNLSDTHHAADTRRGRSNYAKVKGSYKKKN